MDLSSSLSLVRHHLPRQLSTILMERPSLSLEKNSETQLGSAHLVNV